MSDDATQAGGGGLGPKNTQIGSRRIQVRMKSGKIYGPYQRLEILGFINSQKLSGEEHILFEGTGDWKPITSDPEFFDALQIAVFGADAAPKVPASKQKTSVVEPTLVVKAPAPQAPTKTVAKSAPPKVGSLKLPSGDTQLPGMTSTPKIGLDLPSMSGLREVPLETLPPVFTGSDPARKNPKKPPWILIVGVAALFGFIFLSNAPKKEKKTDEGYFIAPLKIKIAYAKPLALVVEDIKVAIPSSPDLINPSTAWNFPTGIGVHRWAADLMDLSTESKPEMRASAAYWARWAWDIIWLGSTISTFDPSEGKSVAKEGWKIYDKLKGKKLLTNSVIALFDSIGLVNDGKWDEAVASLQNLSDLEFAQWFAEELSWWAFWNKGGTGGNKILTLKSSYDSSELNISSKVRSALANKDPVLLERLDELALKDAESNLLWLSAAEYYWRIANDQVQRANGRFVMGLATLSFLPRPFQLVYWKQYADFLAAFGRQATADRANGNVEILKSGNPNSDPKWWDLNQDGLDIAHIVTEILGRSSSNPLNEIDIAVLQVLGPVIPDGALALVAAGNHLAFEGDWTHALKMFKSALKVSNMSVPALGGEVWAYANLFQFDKAYEAYERLAKIPAEASESSKYDALIHLYGREYDEAGHELDEYSKAYPTDAWAHYFKAILELKIEKNVDCMKAANLAQIHGTGELKFRSSLLFLKCRILGGVSVTDALGDYKALYAKNPHSIPIVLGLTEAFMHLELTGEALQVCEDTLRKFPSSYSLRVRLGEIYERKRDYDKAVAFYLSATKEKPESAEAWIHIGKVYEVQEKPLDAARNFETAGHLNPEQPEIWLLAARAYAVAGKFNEAAVLYEKEIDERPAVLSSFIEAAEFMLKYNAPQEVPKIFQKFKANYEDDPRVLTRLAEAYLAMKEFENARSAAATAIAHDARIPEPHRVLAIVFEQQGVFESAKQQFEKYLELNPAAQDSQQIRLKLSRPPFSQ